MNETVGEKKVNCPLYEGPSEPSVRNFKTGGNEFTINNYPDPLIKYISLDSKRLMIVFFCRDDKHLLDSGFFSL